MASRGGSQPAASRPVVSDIAIAKAIATAVRATPGVVDLSPGLLALAATYGPNERAVGVVVRHAGQSGQHDTAVDVHVTVAIPATMEATPTAEGQGDASRVSAMAEPPQGAVLTHVADRVREAVYRAMRDLRVAPPAAVDVFIDDIQVQA